VDRGGLISLAVAHARSLRSAGCARSRDPQALREGWAIYFADRPAVQIAAEGGNSVGRRGSTTSTPRSCAAILTYSAE
jgi:hypothetical protein